MTFGQTPGVTGRLPRVRSAVVCSILYGCAAASLIAACGSAGGSAGSDAAAEPTKTVEIIATEYTFTGDPATEIFAGDTVLMRIVNEGQVQHEMQVLDGDGRLIDRTARVPPGGEDEVVITFESAGVYQVICDVDDHLSRGQQSRFTVPDPPA